MKKLLSMLIACSMLVSLVGCSQDTSSTTSTSSTSTTTTQTSTTTNDTDFVAGTYTATAKGMIDNITLEVVVSDDEIISITVLEQSETSGISDPAFEQVLANVLESQSLNVDTVSGATVTSSALLVAITDALTQAGADIDALKAKAGVEITQAEDYEVTADIIVVGAGGAGLAAAVSATQNGASVIVIEKTSAAGGNTIVSGGIYNAPDPELQEPLGIEDSAEFYATQTWEGGDMVANKSLVDVLCYNAYAGLEWVKELGVEFTDVISQGAGALYQRTHSSVATAGTGFINAYLENLEGKAEIMYNTTGESLIVDDSGAVTGVIATGSTGETITLNANKNVIIATGGFAANIEMREEYNTSGKWDDLGSSILTTNVPAITGDGILMASEIGASLVDMEQIQLLYLANPEDSGAMTKYTPKCLSGTDQIMFVNLEGERFVQEDGRRDDICSALIAQTDGLMYIVESMDGSLTVDLEDMVLADGTPILEAVEAGNVLMADTIEDLAAQIGCDADTLQATFDSFNEAVAAGTDEFGRTLYSTELVTGPFFATPRVAAVHHTMGGIEINTDAQVLDTDGNVIEGLYACGEVTGGIHGANRLGGNAIVDTVVFGKLAGENASK